MRHRPILVAAAMIVLSSAALIPLAGQQIKPRVLKKPPVTFAPPYDPADNRALLFGWTGTAETALTFDRFFDGDHTLMGWFMPQYTRAYTGPIFGNGGSGTYTVGHGSYYLGTGFHAGGDGESKYGGGYGSGHPVLYVRIGGFKAVYLAPSYSAGAWHHLAVVRNGAVISLFLDGKRLTPVTIAKSTGRDGRVIKRASPAPEIKLSATFTGKPRGRLRFGRTGSLAGAQAYGMIDDVAVFSRALTAGEIAAARDQRRFTGQETGLLASWSFDRPPSGRASDAAEVQQKGRLFVVPVKATAADAWAMASAFFLGSTEGADPRVPFPVNEPWRVTQGADSPTPSHHDASAFSYDFVRATTGSVGATILCAATGRVSMYKRIETGEEGNVVLEVADGIHVTYGHLGSLNAKIKGGTAKDFGNKTRYVFAPGQGPLIKAGEVIGTVGATNKHLHIDGNAGNAVGVTIPLAFFNYQASDDQGKTWKPVVKGTPSKGQWIRRVQ